MFSGRYDLAEAISGCGTTESLETFANQSQYKMKVFTDNSNVKHLIPNWITDEVAGKIF